MSVKAQDVRRKDGLRWIPKRPCTFCIHSGNICQGRYTQNIMKKIKKKHRKKHVLFGLHMTLTAAILYSVRLCRVSAVMSMDARMIIKQTNMFLN